MQRKLLFFPRDQVFEDCYPMKSLQAQPVTDGDLRYYYLQAESPRAILLHFHGNGGNACDRVEHVLGLRDLPINVMMVEYPGYAQKSNQAGQAEILKIADLALEQAKKTGLPILLMGESLGTGVATYLARAPEVIGLILQSPYTSIRAVAQWHIKWIPAGLILRHPFPADQWAKGVSCPVLAIHGTEDSTIPFHIGREQSQNFKQVEWVSLEGAHHNDHFSESFIRSFWKPVHDFIGVQIKKAPHL